GIEPTAYALPRRSAEQIRGGYRSGRPFSPVLGPRPGACTCEWQTCRAPTASRINANGHARSRTSTFFGPGAQLLVGPACAGVVRVEGVTANKWTAALRLSVIISKPATAECSDRAGSERTDSPRAPP